MRSAGRCSPSVMRFDSGASIGDTWLIRLLLVFCLTCGQLMPNYGRAEETSGVTLNHQCIEIIFDTEQGSTVFALTPATQWGTREDGTPILQLPSECFVRPVTEDDPDPDWNETQAANPTATTENMASGLQEYGADPGMVENARNSIQRRIDRMGSQPDQAQALQQASREEIANPEADYAAVLLGLVTAGCMLAGGGPICSILPAIFAPFFGQGLEAEHVERAAQIASVISEGIPLSDDDYTFLADRGAATWALHEHFTRQHGPSSSDRFEAVTGRPVPENLTLILTELQALARLRQVSCDDISEVVGESSVQLTSEQRENLLATLIDSDREMPRQRADALRRCVERFFIQR